MAIRATSSTGRPTPTNPSTPHPTLVAAAADQIADIHHANAQRTYRTATGQSHPQPGAFQLVFSDLGTPKPGRHDTASDRLRQL